MTEPHSGADVRLESCQADFINFDPYAVCIRCALAWDPRVPPQPACAAATFTRLAEILDREAFECEMSHRAVRALVAGGVRGDPLASLKRAVDLRSALRLVNRIRGNDQIRDLLKPGKNQE